MLPKLSDEDNWSEGPGGLLRTPCNCVTASKNVSRRAQCKEGGAAGDSPLVPPLLTTTESKSCLSQQAGAGALVMSQEPGSLFSSF